MNQFDFIDAMPGFISIIDLNLRYLCINKNLSDLLGNGNEIQGKLVGGNCKSQIFQMQRLLDLPIESEITWEYFYKDMCLAVSSKRHENFIVSQAVDISDRKLLEQELRDSNQKNRILLKASKGELAKSLFENPEQETLIRIEYEIRENSAKVQQVEKLLFWDENSLLSRIKNLEILQNNDNNNWEKLDDIQGKITNLTAITNFIAKIPGGFKTILLALVVLNIAGIFVIDMAVRVLNLEEIIPIERRR